MATVGISSRGFLGYISDDREGKIKQKRAYNFGFSLQRLVKKFNKYWGHHLSKAWHWAAYE
jgi:hypothetical protein